MKKSVILVVAFTFVILLTVPAWAQYQDTQGTGQSIGACIIIDKPGSYVLARNITARRSDLKRIAADRTAGCILIVADFVSLDLHGCSLRVRGWTWKLLGFTALPMLAVSSPSQLTSETDRLPTSTGALTSTRTQRRGLRPYG
jgi:hypothetical protein